MARHEEIQFHEHEFYSTVLKGIFSLDLDSVVFMLRKKQAKNMYPDLEENEEGHLTMKILKWTMWICSD